MVEVERFARVRVRDGGARGRRIGADGSTSDRARFESLSLFLAGTGRAISPSHSKSRLRVYMSMSSSSSAALASSTASSASSLGTRLNSPPLASQIQLISHSKSLSFSS